MPPYHGYISPCPDNLNAPSARVSTCAHMNSTPPCVVDQRLRISGAEADFMAVIHLHQRRIDTMAHTHTHTHATHIYTTHICIHTTQAHTHTYMHRHTYTHTYIHIHTHWHTQTCMHTHRDTHTQTHKKTSTPLLCAIRS